MVSGPPVSGKSSLAPALATALDLPLLAKDVVKDALIDALGAPDLPRSRELGRAAVHVLLAVARTAGYGLLEGVWFDRTVAGGWPVLEVDTTGEVDVDALAARVVAARVVAAARQGVSGKSAAPRSKPSTRRWGD